MTLIPVTLNSVFLYGFACGLLAVACYVGLGKIRIPSARADMEALQDAVTKGTQAEVQAMRTLTSFRREYHDGTGALVKEAHKLAREVARLKTVIKDRGIE